MGSGRFTNVIMLRSDFVVNEQKCNLIYFGVFAHDKFQRILNGFNANKWGLKDDTTIEERVRNSLDMGLVYTFPK